MTVTWVDSGRNCPSCGGQLLQDTLLVRRSGEEFARRVEGRRLRCLIGCRFHRTFSAALLPVD